MTAIRVLIVDDSAFVRKVLRAVLSSASDIEVVGQAVDGLEALERIDELSPDVIALDLTMPELDGLGVLEVLATREKSPRVIVVSSAERDSEEAVRALQLGAVEVIKKPTAVATDQLYDVRAELVTKVRVAAGALVRNAPEPPRAIAPQPAPREILHGSELLVIGTSTGGPRALTWLMSELPRDMPIPIAVVVHIPVGFTQALAARLDGGSALEVVEASDGLELRAGRVVLAQAGAHLRLTRVGKGVARCSLSYDEQASPHKPSVDALFESAAEAFGAAAIGVVLTGMGDDGLAGARAIRARGGRILAEAESSCVVYGMPRTVVEAGLADDVQPLDRVTRTVLSWL